MVVLTYQSRLPMLTPTINRSKITMTENKQKIKAQVTTVKIGLIEIEGLMLPDGTFGVAVPQICSLFQIDKNQGSRKIKSILGKDFQFDKWRSTLHPKSVNVLHLKDFEFLLFELTIQHNEYAVNFSRLLVGLSLQQLFCDAFEIQFKEGDRQNWLANRQLGKVVRRTWTDSVRDWLNQYGDLLSENGRKFIWINISDRVYTHLFSRSSKTLRKDWSVEEIRESLTTEELEYVRQIEALAGRILDQTGAEITPLEAIDEAIRRLLIEPIDR